MISVRQLMDDQFRHFNARETLDAARAWENLLAEGGQMFLAMAGAMSTAELGISLAEMIRQGKISAISCTAANLEEDIFNLFAHNEYKMVPEYRDLSPEAEKELYDAGFNRVTDTCIPETVFRAVEHKLVDIWAQAAKNNESMFPYQFMWAVLDDPELKDQYQIDPANSWLLAAKEMNIPVFTPGFEDSTMGNIFTANVMTGKISSHSAVKSGTQQLQFLADWYKGRCDNNVPVGFFQIGGGIAGDFAICVVPMLLQDLELDIPYWAYFAQISDSTTSYGSYSGAVPNEKITWGKLDKNTPKFMINSDASIVVPLIFAYILEA